MIVYRHIRLDKNEPFYIGIGKSEKRAYDKRSRNKTWKGIVNKTDYRIEILFDNLTLNQAREKEKELISLYGRKDLGTGTLANLTDGGELVYTITNEIRKNMSDAHIGIRQSDESKKKISETLKGRTFTDEHLLNLSKSLKGKPGNKTTFRKGHILSDETKRKISETLKKRNSEKQ
jgi:hypothetical protein